MADEQAEQQEAPKGGLPIKTIAIVAAIMVVEAVAVFGLIMVTGMGPSVTSAQELEGEAEADRERPVEILLIEDKFPNLTTSRVWLYETEIYLKVRQKNVERVEQIQERSKAEIEEQVGLIFSRAQDRQLKEPGRETVTRQLQAYLEEAFGHDADGMPRVERVIISKLNPILADL